MIADFLNQTAVDALSLAERLVTELIGITTENAAIIEALRNFREAADLLHECRSDTTVLQSPKALNPFDRATRQRLSIYMNTDRNWIRQFSEGSVLEKAEAVRQAAHSFSIARNFPKCELEGAAKHFRTVEELDATNPDHVGDSIHNA